jgi:hypothetical protein
MRCDNEFTSEQIERRAIFLALLAAWCNLAAPFHGATARMWFRDENACR